MGWSGRAAGGGAGCCAVCQGRRAGRAGGYLLPVWIRAAAWSAVLWIRQAGGVIRCSLCGRSATSAADQCGRWCPMCCGSGRAAGVDQEKKEAGRARRVWRCPACCAVCCCDLLPWPRSTERRRGYCFTVFPGGTLRRAGGVRFFTLPGSALCVGLELSEL